MLGNVSYRLDDTIAAIATASGASARAIIRIAGPGVAHCLAAIFEAELPEDVATTEELLGRIRTACVLPGRILLDAAGRRLPAQVYYWPDARSFTKSPLAEIQLIGSQPLAASVLETVCGQGVRPAVGGEFTLRAFLAGRIDLTQAEAVLGLVDAGSEREFDVALHQLAGGVSGPLTQLRDALLDALADLEAGLDFVEEDIEFISGSQLLNQLTQVQGEVSSLLAQMKSRVVATDAVRVVLLGSPNVGKSSLFNCLVGGTALESEQPGTTRDYLSEKLDLDGIGCQLIDTAGVIRENGSDPIRMAAQAMTARQGEEAHIRLLCLDASRPLLDWEKEQLACQHESGGLVVLTKCDAVPGLPHHDAHAELSAAIRTSSLTGTGLDALRREIRCHALAVPTEVGTAVTNTTVRCRESLRRADEALTRSIDGARRGLGHEIVAAEMRMALDELGHVVGAVYTEDMLERIFSRFCIGK